MPGQHPRELLPDPARPTCHRQGKGWEGGVSTAHGQREWTAPSCRTGPPGWHSHRAGHPPAPRQVCSGTVTAVLLLPHLCLLLPYPPPSPAGSEPPCPVIAGIFPGMSSGFGLVGSVPAGHQLRSCRGRSSGTETWKTLLSCCQPFPARSQGESPCLGSRYHIPGPQRL